MSRGARSRSTRRSLALVIGTTILLLAPQIAFASPGSQLWVARYNGPASADDNADDLGVSPDGAMVYVTGGSYRSNGVPDYATIAYDASTGSQLWARRYNGPGSGPDYADALGVSPDGAAIYVTGGSYGLASYDYATVAYDASTGTQLWVSRYDGPGIHADAARAIGVSPDGSAVYVTGWSPDPTSYYDYATVAYDASTGSQLWVTRYNGHANGGDFAGDLRVSPDGSAVYVTGYSDRSSGYPDYATVAYDASTGSELWVSRYNGSKWGDYPHDLGVSPDGSTVFVTGGSGPSVGGDADYATVAYDASTGSELWVSRYNGPGDGSDVSNALGLSPDGSTVFVTGGSGGLATHQDYATVAYDASTGSQLWVTRYDGPSNADTGDALGVSPDGSAVYVTGDSKRSTGVPDYATFAYDASTGSKLWGARYNGPGNAEDYPYALGVSPDGSAVYVTGYSDRSTGVSDYATVAYTAA